MDSIDIGIRPGDLLAGKYQVERVLGVGGMGVVVAAQHVQLDTHVAIKFLLPEMLGNPEAASRFAREARAAVRITSEHVARVIDVGALENGAPFMVMEYLEGGDLARWLEERGPLPIELAVEFVLQACVAVAEAHGLGIVHRDLKPSNLFCIRRPDGQLSIKVLDFGISKVSYGSGGFESKNMSMTKTAAVMGTPLYMSPEQMQSTKDVDARSDIWALGVILYELLAGRVPFFGEAITEVAVKVAMQAPASLRGIRPDVPPGLEAVISKCLEKARGNRYANVAEFAVRLAEFAPPRAIALVERIRGTIQSAGLSLGASAMPASLHATERGTPPGTGAPLSRTRSTLGTRSIAQHKGVVAATAIVVGTLAVAGSIAIRARLRSGLHVDVVPSANSMVPVGDAQAVPPPVSLDSGALQDSSAPSAESPMPEPRAPTRPLHPTPVIKPSASAPPDLHGLPVPVPPSPAPAPKPSATRYNPLDHL